jgi:hypothetical protein
VILIFVPGLVIIGTSPTSRQVTTQLNSTASETNFVFSPPIAPWLSSFLPFAYFAIVLAFGCFAGLLVMFPWKPPSNLTAEQAFLYYAYDVFHYLQLYRNDTTQKLDQKRAIVAANRLADKFQVRGLYTRELSRKELGVPLEKLRKNIRNHLVYSIRTGNQKTLEECSIAVREIGKFLLSPDLPSLKDLKILLEVIPGKTDKKDLSRYS